MSTLRRARVVVGIVITAVLIAVMIYLAAPTLVVRGYVVIERALAAMRRREVGTAAGVVPYLDGGRGPVIVLLHGFEDSKDSWIPFAKALIPDHRVIIPDLHGFGENHAATNGDYRPDAEARRIRQFLGALGIGAADIVGVSMGGEVAAAYAVRFPALTRTLALISSAGVRPDSLTLMDRRILGGANPFHLTDMASVDSLIGVLADSGFKLPSLVKRAMLAEFAERGAQWDSVFAQITSPPMLYFVDSIAPAIGTSTLVLWGAHDPLFPVSAGRRLASRIPGASLVVLPDCGHLCPVTRTAETASRYRAFLLSAGSAGATKSSSQGGRKITSMAR